MSENCEVCDVHLHSTTHRHLLGHDLCNDHAQEVLIPLTAYATTTIEELKKYYESDRRAGSTSQNGR